MVAQSDSRVRGRVRSEAGQLGLVPTLPPSQLGLGSTRPVNVQFDDQTFRMGIYHSVRSTQPGNPVEFLKKF